MTETAGDWLMYAAPMDLLGGSVGMNIEPEFTSASGLLGMHDPVDQVNCLTLLQFLIFISQ